MKSSKSSLFLMELIISILFFSIASAVCIQLFAKAHLLDLKTNRQNQTVIWTQNLASLWQTSGGELSDVYKRLQEDNQASDASILLTNTGNTLRLFFDNDFSLTDASSDSYYTIELCSLGYDDETKLYSAELSFYHESEVFYHLTLSFHPAIERGTVSNE